MFGAGKKTWSAYCERGWADDVLPVVSNPEVPISKASALRTLGKTPSLKNKKGDATGLKAWTTLNVTSSMIDRWAADDDLGICLRCGEIAAFDCDCDDQEVAETILDLFTSSFGSVPLRTRGDSPRWLAVVRVSSPMGKKRVMLGGDNVLELLCQGQQFVAEGTHPKGERYAWSAPLIKDELPVATVDQINTFLEYVNSMCGEGDVVSQSISERVVGDSVDMSDPLADWLRDNGYVLSEKAGQLNIRCPWESEHSESEGNLTATSYFSRGAFGHTEPGFSCLHAHCAHRTYDDFLAWAVSQGFELVSHETFPEVAGEDESAESVRLRRVITANTNAKTGDVKATLPTVVAALSLPDLCGVDLRSDTFTWSTVYRRAGTNEPWDALTDSASVAIREHLEREQHFSPIGKDLMRDAVDLVADQNKIDTMLDYVERNIPEWDGKPRIANSLIDYCGADSNAYSRACGTYLWTALAGRAVSVDGIKADITLILVGRQGMRKSTFAEAIALEPRFFGNLSLTDGEEKAIRLMRGRTVMEVPELAGMTRKDSADLKRFLTLESGSLVPKYKEFAVDYPRRCIFVMTTNEFEILSDPTGARRFAPIVVQKIKIEALKKELPQLWAEGLAVFREKGIRYRELERLARKKHGEFRLSDSWDEAVSAWVNEQENSSEGAPLTSLNILQNAIGLPVSRVKISDGRRLSLIMRELGYAQQVRRIDGKSQRVWTPLPSVDAEEEDDSDDSYSTY